MALNVIDKTSSRFYVLYTEKIVSLTLSLSRILCNELIQPLLDYASTVWFPNPLKKLRLRLQAMQNKCIRLCLWLDKMSRICVKGFRN